jgi:autotransporter-associated beta strand protein
MKSFSAWWNLRLDKIRKGTLMRKTVQILLVGWVASAAPSLFAAALTWTGNTTANWNALDGFNALPSASDSLTFNTAGAVGASLNNDVTNYNVVSISYSATASAYTFSGNAFTLGTGGSANAIVMSTGGAATQIINNNITLAGSANANRRLVFGNGSMTLILNGNIDFSDKRLDHSAGGLGRVVLNGSNTGTGTAANPFGLAFTTTYIGNVVGGTLVLGNKNALGSPGANIGIQASNSMTLLANTDLSGLNAVNNGIVMGQGNLAIAGANNLEISGNVYSANGNRVLTITNTATTTLSGNVYLSANNASAGSLNFNVGAAGATVSGTIANNNGANTLACNLIKIGTGKLRLTGNNTYSGFTGVGGGILELDGTHLGAGNYVVSNTGTLGGTGTITFGIGAGVMVDFNGNLAPGASIGTLTLDGGVTASPVLAFFSTGKGVFELGPVNTSDTLKVVNSAAGDIAFANTVLNFIDTTGGLLNGQYLLFDVDANDAYTGLVEDGSGNILSGLSIGTGLGSYTSGLRQIGQDIFLNVAPIPEPSSVAILGAGLLAVLTTRRRRRIVPG